MSGTFIAIIILAAIVGGYLIDYQKNKLEWQSKNNQSDKELNEVREEMKRMKRRIENLEAIAADDSPGRTHQSSTSSATIEIVDEQTIKEENRKTVANKAKISR
jgi:phage shock protein B